ncbi:hypothetical protein Tco_1566817, partial [Tanacetum coccineum]
RIGYDKQIGHYENQRAVNVVGARDNVGTQVVQQSGIQCFNYKEFRHVARECKKAKQVRDSAYHKEKTLMCKQEKDGIQLTAEQVDWRDDTYDEPEDHEFEAHYMYMEKIQEVIPNDADNSRPVFDTEPLKKTKPKTTLNGQCTRSVVVSCLNPNSNWKRGVFSLRDWHGLVGDYNQFKAL